MPLPSGGRWLGDCFVGVTKETPMRTLTVFGLLWLSACASDTSHDRPAASVESEASAGGDNTAHHATTTSDVHAEKRAVSSDDHAQPSDNAAPTVTGQHAPNNTGINERDTQPGVANAGDQPNDSSDLDLTQRIRKAVMADDTLSFTAKNAKIIAQGGHVTLRGPVKSAAERSTIATIAGRIAGAQRVDNQLEVEQ
jgi:hyperosmotically inducible periplasmic protein